MTTTATGTLGGTSFTDAVFTVTLTGDTSEVTSGPSPYTAFLVDPGTATLTIAGLGTATFTDPMLVASTYLSSLDGQDGVLIVDNAPGNGTAVSATTGSVFYGYNLESSLGPITEGGGIGNGGGPDNTFPTTAGVLEFATGQDNIGSTFTAVTTPEPGTFVLLSGGLVAIAAASDRRRRRPSNRRRAGI